jgi:phosphoglucosamine mutase
MGALQSAVVEQQADLGIAFDGDGDRVLFVDGSGEIVDGDELLYVIVRHRHTSKMGCNGVAGTMMSNMGLELALQDMGVPFQRTKVGDRYVVEALKKNGWLLGGESSGHILCSDLNTTGDGIVAALQVILAISESGQTLSQLKSGMCKFPQAMHNVKLSRKVNIEGNTKINGFVAAAEKRLNGCGRILLRPSGTEPVIRVMVEGEDQQVINQMASELASVVKQEVG